MELDIKNIEETPHLLELLLEVEDVLDSLDVYVFRNWFDGEVVSGPSVKRYWVSIKLKFEEHKMPDPRAAKRLLKHGVMVEYQKEQEEDISEHGQEGDTKTVWIVTIDVPRKLLNGMNDSGTDFYDDEIDIEDIESAKDLGVDQESGYDQSGDTGAQSNA